MSPTTVNALEASKRSGLDYRTVLNHVRAGRLPAIKAGKEWRIAVTDLDTWLDERGGKRRQKAEGAAVADHLLDLESVATGKILPVGVKGAANVIEHWNAGYEKGLETPEGFESLTQARDALIALEPVISELKAIDYIANFRRSLLAQVPDRGRPKAER
jgi:excisionase family DNA binding protein